MSARAQRKPQFISPDEVSRAMADWKFRQRSWVSLPGVSILEYG